MKRPVPRALARELALAREPSEPSLHKVATEDAGACSVEGTFRVLRGEDTSIDAKTFVKLCRRCGLVDSQFSTHDARLVYSASMPLQKARMELSNFQSALADIAEKRGLGLEVVLSMVSSYEHASADGQDNVRVSWADWSVKTVVLKPLPPQDAGVAARRPRSSEHRPRSSSVPSVGTPGSVSRGGSAGVGIAGVGIAGVELPPHEGGSVHMDEDVPLQVLPQMMDGSF